MNNSGSNCPGRMAALLGIFALRQRTNWEPLRAELGKTVKAERPSCTSEAWPQLPDAPVLHKQLKETQKTFQQRIQQREKDVQQLRETVESHKRSAQTAVEDKIREKAAVSRAEGRLERLEQEINDLRRRDAELEQLSHTQDHIQFLQSFQSLSAPPEYTDENDDPLISFISSDDLRESVHQLRVKLEDFCKEELKKISDRVTFTNIVPKGQEGLPTM
ncbi:hypothetical protein QQF64_014330 [Cirrhinus molitorella]|uniref:TRIM8/14/16/25/29/45/65 coiled-coil region domain-containing protein n=1 Tax=Cirrhinus molitorella TaxID=172907 RepID=A0ABR3NT55_9TELE